MGEFISYLQAATDPAEFPAEYEANKTDPSRDVNLPMWYSTLPHVRADVVAVMRQFDVGRTVFALIRITLPDDGGVNEEFSILSVGNPQSTIDKDRSERLYVGAKFRFPLSSDEPLHPGVFALDGPDLWHEPDVTDTGRGPCKKRSSARRCSCGKCAWPDPGQKMDNWGPLPVAPAAVGTSDLA